MSQATRKFVSYSAAWVSSVCAHWNSTPLRGTKLPVDSLSFPYITPTEKLPVPIPTVDQIEESEEVLLERTAAKVVVVASHFVVKFGYGVNLEEGRTMMFVQENTTLPVPHVYALFQDKKTGKNYIVMERIHGDTLQAKWDSLTPVEKRSIAVQIRDHLHSLRQLQSQTFCSVSNKPLRDNVFWTADETLNWAGPYDSEEQLNNAIVNMYKHSDSSYVQRKAEYCERAMQSELFGHKPTFTHGDLQRKNILLRADSNSKNSVVFIDWETGGFYPAYWEYARAYWAVRYEDDWESYLCDILTPFHRESHMLCTIFRDLSF